MPVLAPTKPATPAAPVAAPAHVPHPLAGIASATLTALAAAPAAPARNAAPATAIAYISLLVASNPKKPGTKSHARFALYQHGQTVSAYRAACLAAKVPARVTSADLLWDRQHGFISLHSAAPATPQGTAVSTQGLAVKSA